MATPGAVNSRRPRRSVACASAARRRSQTQGGFSLAETLFALAILSLTGAAVLTSIAGAVTTCNDSVYRSVGRGLAQQLMEEIAAAKISSSTTSTTSATTRAGFTTIDDYAGWRDTPPQSKAGIPLGTEQVFSTTTGTYSSYSMTTTSERPTSLRVRTDFMQRFTRTVVVERVVPTASGWTVVTGTTPYRRVKVSVTYSVAPGKAQPVAVLSRVFASIPPAP